MAVTTWTAGQVLAAQDLNDTFASKLDNVMTTKGDLITQTSSDLVSRLAIGTNGYVLTADSSDPLGMSWAEVAPGKIAQIVRGTDGSDRSTTSTSLVDTNLDVTITPSDSGSAVLLIASVYIRADNGSSDDNLCTFRISDSSNNPISGAEFVSFGTQNLSDNGGTQRFFAGSSVLVGYATPATTSAVTYKLRFSSGNASVTTRVQGASMTSSMYAIEVTP